MMNLFIFLNNEKENWKRQIDLVHTNIMVHKYMLFDM